MKAADVQVVRIKPPVAAYWLSNHRNDPEERTSDWVVWFFKTIAAAKGVWKNAGTQRLSAATCWRIRPKAPTAAAVIDELKKQAAAMNYCKLEVFAVIPPKTLRK